MKLFMAGTLGYHPKITSIIKIGLSLLECNSLNPHHRIKTIGNMLSGEDLIIWKIYL